MLKDEMPTSYWRIYSASFVLNVLRNFLLRMITKADMIIETIIINRITMWVNPRLGVVLK